MELEIQKYLRGGKSLAFLQVELGIKHSLHDVHPLVILNYSQIDSPKTHPVVAECRGIVLETTNWDVVAKPFSRFFNWGEALDLAPSFDFSDFFAYSKEDGSLIVIYHYAGKWHVNTRGSFGFQKVQYESYTWHQAICSVLGIADLQELDLRLDRNLTYVCEYCSVGNKVVRLYKEPKLYLLAVFQGLQELDYKTVDASLPVGFVRPERHVFKSVSDIQEFLNKNSQIDPTFEGFVICDKHGHRWKIKSSTFVSLHHAQGNGNIFNPKYMLPWILYNEGDEILTYFPEVEQKYNEVKAIVNALKSDTLAAWEKFKTIENQKEFALAVTGTKGIFTGLLFNLKKNKELTFDKAWQENEKSILEYLRKRHGTYFPLKEEE